MGGWPMQSTVLILASGLLWRYPLVKDGLFCPSSCFSISKSEVLLASYWFLHIKLFFASCQFYPMVRNFFPINCCYPPSICHVNFPELWFSWLSYTIFRSVTKALILLVKWNWSSIAITDERSNSFWIFWFLLNNQNTLHYLKRSKHLVC